MEYEEFVRGCHLGVFPSYYEPWGYTPGKILGRFDPLRQYLYRMKQNQNPVMFPQSCSTSVVR